MATLDNSSKSYYTVRMIEMVKILAKALWAAASQAYEEEIVFTQEEDDLIGLGREYESREDWTEQRIRDWVAAGSEL